MSDVTAADDRSRQRLVRWTAPRRPAPGDALPSGLEMVRAIRDGTAAPPPMADVVGYSCVVAEPGEVGMRLDHDGSIENSAGTIHGGAIATMLDTAMGAAVNTELPAGSSVLTLDLTVTYLRPARPEDCPLVATGRAVHCGSRNGYATGEVRDRQDRLVAHAVGNFSILRATP